MPRVQLLETHPIFYALHAGYAPLWILLHRSPEKASGMRGFLLGMTCVGIALGVSPGWAWGGIPNPDDPKVQYEAGMAYLTGQGVAKDPAEAVRLLRQAALRGYAEAQVQLGVCTQQGYGVARDPAQALNWFRRAAEQGNARGQLQVAFAYWRGQGVAPDLKEAIAWFQKAAENGHPKAQAELGIAYREGRGVAADPEQAAFWLGLAARNGSPMARAMYAGALQALSEAQRTQLEKRLDSWQREHPGEPGASDS